MAAITPQLVKELRDKTDAGMGECKKALVECGGDLEAAVDYLRKAGIAKSVRRSDRATKEGKVFALVEGGKAVMLEILCETDFVANNEKFRAFGNEAAKRILDATSGSGDITEAAQKMEEEELAALFAKFGEKMILSRAVRMESDGLIGNYLHLGGKIGVLVELEGKANAEIAKNVCLQIAAFNPLYITSKDIPEEAIAHEREIAKAQLSGKPENIIDKIVIGKLSKWYSEVSPVNPPWTLADKTCFATLSPPVPAKTFIRCGVGP